MTEPSPELTETYREPIVKQESGKLKAPDNIIQSPLAARAIFYKYRSDSLKRIQLAAEIEGMAAGNPPYNSAKLEKDGLGHITNINNFDAGGTLAKEDQAFWNLLNGTEYLVKFDIQDPDKFNIPNWELILAKNFTKVVRHWKDFKRQVNCLTTQLNKFGVSPLFWENEYDWKWKTIEYQRFFVPDQASTDLSLLTSVAVVSDYTVQYLWECHQYTIKYPEQSCWDKEELEFLLLQKANSFAKYWGVGGLQTFFDLQLRFQNGDFNYMPIFTDSVQLVSLFYKEYDGKFTHMMFDPVSDRNNKFLFQADRQYERLTDALGLFTSSPGCFTIHSNRGLGMKIYQPMQAIMRMDCSIFDMALLASTPLIKTIPGGARSLDPIRVYHGVPTNIGTAELQQNNLGANIPGVVQAAQYMKQKVQFNMLNYGEDPSYPDSSEGGKTDTQERHQSFRETSMLKNIVAHFYENFDPVYRNMYMRMMASKKGYPGYEEAQEFKRLCLEDGVPERIFSTTKLNPWGMPNHLDLKAARVAGDGSTAGTILGLEGLAQDVPAFSPKGQKFYTKMKVQSLLGADYVDAFTSQDQPDELSGGASLAGTENAIMRLGQSPIFSPENEQKAHIAIHFALGMEIVKARAEQRMGAREADKQYSVLIPHMAEHIGYEQQIPYEKPFVDSIKKQWEQLREQATLNRKNAEAEVQAEIRKQQQLQDKENEALSDIKRKDMVALADIKRDDVKAGAKIEQSKEANQTRGEIMRDATMKKAENERLKVQLEGQNKSQESLSKLNGELNSMMGNTISPSDIEPIEQ